MLLELRKVSKRYDDNLVIPGLSLAVTEAFRSGFGSWASRQVQ